jgi:hypothetical protein
MSDEWTWEDRQDTLDYRQWKAEQDAERNIMRSFENVASLRAELAAALGDIIAYRRMRYADSGMEEARYRELTGHAYDDE